MMNGAAGGPRIVRIPGGLGMLSPMRTNARPLTETPVLASGPITIGYGKPQTELTIMQIDPVVASGIPLAVMNGGNTAMIEPVSGGPDAPGLTITIAPILTGGPGMHLLHAGENEVIPLTATVAPLSVPDNPPSTVAPRLALKLPFMPALMSVFI